MSRPEEAEPVTEASLSVVCLSLGCPSKDLEQALPSILPQAPQASIPAGKDFVASPLMKKALESISFSFFFFFWSGGCYIVVLLYSNSFCLAGSP